MATQRESAIRRSLLLELSALRERCAALESGRASAQAMSTARKTGVDSGAQSLEEGGALDQNDKDAIEAFFNASDDFVSQFNDSNGNVIYKMVAPTSQKIRRIGKKKGATLKDVNAWRWIKTTARHFKQEGKILVPNCTEIMKTSHGRERAPQNPDWYYIRCAAVLRAIYLRPGVGYGGLSKRFGNKKNYGSCPEHAVRSARGLLHWACKSLNKLGLVEHGLTSGQRVTRKGRKVADSLAFQVQIRRFGKSKE